MAWLRRRRRITAAPGHWNDWELPAFVMLNIRLSPQSASRLRARNPDWASAPKQ
jgi:nicotinate-nucleotide adenylyltransferase